MGTPFGIVSALTITLIETMHSDFLTQKRKLHNTSSCRMFSNNISDHRENWGYSTFADSQQMIQCRLNWFLLNWNCSINFKNVRTNHGIREYFVRWIMKSNLQRRLLTRDVFIISVHVTEDWVRFARYRLIISIHLWSEEQSPGFQIQQLLVGDMTIN